MHGKIVSIHYLRGLCALLVVVAHLSYLLPGHMEARIPGALGVDLFFMISGFIMLLVTRERAEPPSTFIIKRFVRIYPLFFVVWLLAVLTVHRDATLGQSLCALALCLQDYASQGPEFGYNLLGPPWTLTYEVYFYLLFCGAMALSPRWRGPICALAIGILTVGLQLAVNGSYALSSQSAARFADTRGWQAPLTILSDTVFYEFVFGMLVAALLPRLAALKEHAVLRRASVAVLGLAVAAAFVVGPVPFGMAGGFWFAAPIFAAVVVLGTQVRLPALRSLSFLGDISYALYLVHFPLMNLAQKSLPAPNGAAEKLAMFVTLLLASVCLAYFFHRAIERPMIRLGRVAANGAGLVKQT
ncbi:acyltransferase [Xanthomonas sp. Kuri4-1]